MNGLGGLKELLQVIMKVSFRAQSAPIPNGYGIVILLPPPHLYGQPGFVIAASLTYSSCCAKSSVMSWHSSEFSELRLLGMVVQLSVAKGGCIECQDCLE
ncbi:hypothetical protein LguiB_006001 [Lonicera macranthoides]